MAPLDRRKKDRARKEWKKRIMKIMAEDLGKLLNREALEKL